MKSSIPLPREEDEQAALFQWASLLEGRYPELRLMYHIPNEGKRNPRTGARMRSVGLKRGVPDIHLPVARGKYHSLYIEMKRVKGGRLTAEQSDWVKDLSAQDNAVLVCNGCEEAIKAILAYLTNGVVGQ